MGKKTKLLNLLPYLPLVVWLVRFALGFSHTIEVTRHYTSAINLSRQYTVGGFPLLYNLAAFANLADDLLLLALAWFAYKYLKQKLQKPQSQSQSR